MKRITFIPGKRQATVETDTGQRHYKTTHASTERLYSIWRRLPNERKRLGMYDQTWFQLRVER